MKPPVSLLHEVDIPTQKATFGMGCFWSNDSLFGATAGVVRTRVGYSGGTSKNPYYRNMSDSEYVSDSAESVSPQPPPPPPKKVTKKKATAAVATTPVVNTAATKRKVAESTPSSSSSGDHTEVIEIDFDPATVNYVNLLDMFWANHEYGLTTKLKRQYQSMILYHDEEQRLAAEASYKDMQEQCKGQLRTEIAPAGPFYPAEDYHQKYRLQGHKDLCRSLGLDAKRLQTSHLAARLNGYLVGVGGKTQFEQEVGKLGLTEKQADYVRRELERNQGGALYC